ncbi:MAG: hypothetical protein KDA20_03895 [Phycisphaerales bacterium]|nr:hypothetical protein [Phycisphaerales bacterium]
MIRALCFAAALAAPLACAAAAPIAITNPSFEDISGESPFNEFTFGPLNGWDLYDPNNVTNGGAGSTFYIGTLTPFEPDPVGAPGVYANFPAGAADGQRVGIAFNFVGSDGIGEYGYQQTLTDQLIAFRQYTLRVEVGNIASATAMSGQFFDLDGFPGYRVELRAGANLIAQDDNTLAGSIPEGAFATSAVALSTNGSTVGLGEPLSIRLINLNQLDPTDPGADLEVDFDHVRLDVVNPCPGDADGSGAVDLADLNLVLFNFGAAVLPGANGDVDGSGQVDLADLNVVLFNFGAVC